MLIVFVYLKIYIPNYKTKKGPKLIAPFYFREFFAGFKSISISAASNIFKNISIEGQDRAANILFIAGCALLTRREISL